MLLTFNVYRLILAFVVALLTTASAIFAATTHTPWSLLGSITALILLYLLAYQVMNTWITGRMRISFVRELSKEINEIVRRFQPKPELGAREIEEVRRVLCGNFLCRHDLMWSLVLTLLFYFAAAVNLASINFVTGFHPTFTTYDQTLFFTGIDMVTASVNPDRVQLTFWANFSRACGLATVAYFTGFFVVSVLSASRTFQDSFIRELCRP